MQKTHYRKRVSAESAKLYRRYTADIGVPALVKGAIEQREHFHALQQAGLSEHAAGAAKAHFSTLLVLAAAAPATRQEAELKVAFLAPLAPPSPGTAYADAEMFATAIHLESERWGIGPSGPTP